MPCHAHGITRTRGDVGVGGGVVVVAVVVVVVVVEVVDNGRGWRPLRPRLLRS